MLPTWIEESKVISELALSLRSVRNDRPGIFTLAYEINNN